VADLLEIRERVRHHGRCEVWRSHFDVTMIVKSLEKCLGICTWRRGVNKHGSSQARLFTVRLVECRLVAVVRPPMSSK
jgi:hypothetical protein